MSYERVISDFDKHIGWQKKSHDSLEDCPSYWRKKIFFHSFDFKIDDWREVRAGDYYEIRDALTGIDRDKFILKRIIQYKSRR